MEWKQYDAIIFDLGGVILNIDYHATIEAFQKLSIPNFEALYTQAKQNHVFDQLETGALSNEDFRAYIREEAQIELTDAEIDQAWNSMLLELPYERIEILKNVGSEKPIYLLSNTNAIHIDWFANYMNTEHIGFANFNDLFVNTHYSSQLGDRKPNVSCFEKVLSINELKPKNTLFIDDSAQHIEGAKKVGLNAYHLEGETIVDLFKT